MKTLRPAAGLRTGVDLREFARELGMRQGLETKFHGSTDSGVGDVFVANRNLQHQLTEWPDFDQRLPHRQPRALQLLRLAADYNTVCGTADFQVIHALLQ